MQIIWNLTVDIKTYAKDRYSVVYPVMTECPCCCAQVKLERHGFYQRNALVRTKCYRIDICRYWCPSCGRTVSLLPWFLLPYFQYTRDTILKSLRKQFKKAGSFLSRQLSAFYCHRFLNNIPAIISALREQHWDEALPYNQNKRAIKIVDRLAVTPPSALTLTSQCATNRILTNFMARSF